MKILNEKTARVLWVFLSALSLAFAPVAAAVQPHFFVNGGFYLPDIDNSVTCGSAGCLVIDDGIALQGGVGFTADDFEYVAAEFGGLYAFGDIDGSGSLPNGDWSVSVLQAGIRVQNSTDALEDNQFYARAGAAFGGAEIDVAGVKADNDGTELYLGLGFRRGVFSGSYLRMDGDQMFSFGIEIPLRHKP